MLYKGKFVPRIYPVNQKFEKEMNPGGLFTIVYIMLETV